MEKNKTSYQKPFGKIVIGDHPMVWHHAGEELSGEDGELGGGVVHKHLRCKSTGIGFTHSPGHIMGCLGRLALLWVLSLWQPDPN